jgi:hypothetical protein
MPSLDQLPRINPLHAPTQWTAPKASSLQAPLMRPPDSSSSLSPPVRHQSSICQAVDENMQRL